jgi:glycosyltransferase involved in cell wall biosynthesis
MTASTDQPRITVVIPTYNRAEWLGGAIESVLAQSRGDFQLIVSDNASTDATADVVDRYDDPRLSYVRLDRHVDLNTHFNRCFSRDETDYLFVLPDDDRMEPALLERAVALLDANPRAGIVHSQVTVVDGDGAVIAERHGMTDLASDAIESGADFIARSIDKSYRVHASTALIRTAAMAGYSLDARDYPLTDLGLWLRMALDWDIAFLAQPLAVYRVHATAYSAGAADVTDGGYIQLASRVVKAREVKLRFVAEHESRLSDPADLRQRTQRRFRHELLEHAAHVTTPERSLRETTAALAACIRLDVRVVVEPAAWRLLAGSLLGRRGVALVKRALHRPQRPAEMTA